MNTQELTALLDRLCNEPHETEWLEFKENQYEPQLLGEYLSAQGRRLIYRIVQFTTETVRFLDLFAQLKALRFP